MTITRADVESLLSATEKHLDDVPKLAVIAELCRAWLAVDDAPSGETVHAGSTGVNFATKTYIPAGTYKLVCVDTPTGGREGV